MKLKKSMGYFKNKNGDVVAKFNVLPGSYFDESLYDVMYVDKYEELQNITVVKHESQDDIKRNQNREKLTQILARESI